VSACDVCDVGIRDAARCRESGRGIEPALEAAGARLVAAEGYGAASAP
jgi:hypothetical protein